MLQGVLHHKKADITTAKQKKSWKINIPGYSSALFLETQHFFLPYIIVLNIHLLIYVYETQIYEILNMSSVEWFIIDTTHTDVSSSNLKVIS